MLARFLPVVLLCLCSAPVAGQPEAVAPAAGDEYSYANTDAFRQRQLSLWLEVDFDERRLRGVALLSLRRHDATERRLVLDTRQLDIASVYLLRAGGTLSLPWRLGAEDPVRGRPLIVEVPASTDQDLFVAITYRTSPEASGLQWVAPAATAGGRSPFLYTQSQAIHARTWVPLQDTPAVRFRFDATVQVPAGLRTVMAAATAESGVAGPCVTPVESRPTACYRFTMPQAIPAYLLALAVGDIAFRAIGPRTGVYAEPPLLEAAVREFADTERMLSVAESLFGPYRWGRYDLLILPPSYPYGGMENPRLSFITPTVIAGDRSLTSLIAHELAHSWSGNLVTNASWEDLWLNEGFTTLLEARLMEALYGERRRRQEDLLGYRSLLEELEALAPSEQRLAAELGDGDPDDAFSAIPYEKGKLFLTWLEQRFGRERWDAFMNRYFDAFAFRSVTTAGFLAYLEAELLARHPGVVTREEVREWVYGAGLPDAAPHPDESVFAEVDAAAARWLAGELAAGDIETSAWSTHDWLYFLGSLPEVMPASRLAALDGAMGLTAAGNNEVLAAWLRIVASSGWEPAFPRLREFLIRIGRLKYIEPLYERLMATEAGAEFARAALEEARPGYHPQTIRDIERIVAGGSG